MYIALQGVKYNKDSVRTRNTDWRYWGERGIPKRWFEGMRLDEQYSPENEIVSYIGLYSLHLHNH